MLTTEKLEELIQDLDRFVWLSSRRIRELVKEVLNWRKEHEGRPSMVHMVMHEQIVEEARKKERVVIKGAVVARLGFHFGQKDDDDFILRGISVDEDGLLALRVDVPAPIRYLNIRVSCEEVPCLVDHKGKK